jgi:putative oxidoreductase
MPLRRRAARGKASPINRLTVESGKSRAPARLGYALANASFEKLREDSMITSATQRQNQSGEAAMARLADRLATLAPAPLDLSPNMIVRPSPSPAVRAALTTSAAIAKRADERARRSRSIMRMIVDSFVAACQFIPYAVVALALRVMMAKVFFFDGQGLIDGLRYSLDFQGYNLSVLVPTQIKGEAIAALAAAHPLLPLPAIPTGYLLGYAEFILPIMLVIGFGSRFAALGLLLVTAVIQLYATPEMFWSVHIYWAAILAVLVSQGPGQISFDTIVRLIAKR